MGLAHPEGKEAKNLSRRRGHLNWVSKAEERGFGCSRQKGPEAQQSTGHSENREAGEGGGRAEAGSGAAGAGEVR